MARAPALSVKDQVSTIFSDLRGEARRKLLVDVANVAFYTHDTNNARLLGGEVPSRRWVDGVEDRPVASVRQGGTIVWEWYLLGNIVQEAYDLLVKYSPVQTPAGDSVKYVEHHRVLINGEQVSPPWKLGANDMAMIVNLLPYSRRIEHGWSKQAPSGVYQLVADILDKKYKRVAHIEFNYEDYFGFAQPPGKQWTPKKSRQVRYPTIIIAPKGMYRSRAARIRSAQNRNAMFPRRTRR